MNTYISCPLLLPLWHLVEQLHNYQNLSGTGSQFFFQLTYLSMSIILQTFKRFVIDLLGQFNHQL